MAAGGPGSSLGLEVSMDDLAAHPLIIEWRDLLSRLDLLTLDQGEEALAIMEYDLQVAREALELELELAVEEALELELELAVE